MERVVLPELLDALPPQDSAAQRSRRDLRRLNAWMNHPKIMAAVLQEHFPLEAPRRIAELGAGDGHFLLRVAQRLRWPETETVLVDRLNAIDPQIEKQFRGLGCRVKSENANAADWLRRQPPGSVDTVVSNLFFHQFETAQLAELLRLAANTARMVIALEPRRAWPAKLCGRFLWAIGCGPVTRHDASISVRAGFRDSEISALWPDKENWELTERSAGLFSHLFIARRKEVAQASRLCASAPLACLPDRNSQARRLCH